MQGNFRSVGRVLLCGLAAACSAATAGPDAAPEGCLPQTPPSSLQEVYCPGTASGLCLVDYPFAF